MVGSWNSKNSSRTNLTTRHDFPTAVSPRRTSLKWCTLLEDMFPDILMEEEMECSIGFYDLLMCRGGIEEEGLGSTKVQVECRADSLFSTVVTLVFSSASVNAITDEILFAQRK